MANYMIQPSQRGFKVLKSRLSVNNFGDIVEVAVGLDDDFKPECFSSYPQAKARCKELIAASTEPIAGLKSLNGVTNAMVAEWLYEEGRLIGIENYEAWFDTLPLKEQSLHKIEFVHAQQKSPCAA